MSRVLKVIVPAGVSMRASNFSKTTMGDSAGILSADHQLFHAGPATVHLAETTSDLALLIACSEIPTVAQSLHGLLSNERLRGCCVRQRETWFNRLERLANKAPDNFSNGLSRKDCHASSTMTCSWSRNVHWRTRCV